MKRGVCADDAWGEGEWEDVYSPEALQQKNMKKTEMSLSPIDTDVSIIGLTKVDGRRHICSNLIRCFYISGHECEC